MPDDKSTLLAGGRLRDPDSQLHAYFETGQVPPRTGNASHGRVH
jgi:hypothetical protein